MHKILAILICLHLSIEPISAINSFDSEDIQEELNEATELYQEEINPDIPEPMVYDLVRPLGAAKGELEINSLIRLDENFEYSPELEYMIGDGLGLEIELPIKNNELESFKIAAQKTFGTNFDNHYIHGMQSLFRYDLNEQRQTYDNLYIAGYRFNRRISDMLMKGLRLSKDDDKLTVSGILNNTLFYQTDKFTLGLEANYVYGNSARGNYFLLMPQIHLPVSKKVSLQLGTGVQRSDDSSLSSTTAARIIFEI